MSKKKIKAHDFLLFFFSMFHIIIKNDLSHLLILYLIEILFYIFLINSK
jgi:hypothetical protein